jgi:hypothetical protein
MNTIIDYHALVGIEKQSCQQGQSMKCLNCQLVKIFFTIFRIDKIYLRFLYAKESILKYKYFILCKQLKT